MRITLGMDVLFIVLKQSEALYYQSKAMTFIC